MVQLQQKESDAARNSLERAIRLQEDFPQAQAALGRLDIAMEEFDAALNIAAVLQKKHPDAAYGYELEGDVHATRGDAKQATENYALAYEKTASAQLAQKLFQSRLQGGEDESAYVALREWLADNPDDVNTRKLLAASLQEAGQQERAIEQYLKILEVDTEDVIVLNNLAWLYQEAGNPEGVRYAERAHEEAPDQPEVTDTLGWLLVQNGDINRGLVLLQEAAVKAPHIPEIRYHVAVALARAGRHDESLKVLNRLLKTGKEFQGVDDARKLREQLGG
jgi:putative PEP-CTERM system TPR-repeat lipoprotein